MIFEPVIKGMKNRAFARHIINGAITHHTDSMVHRKLSWSFIAMRKIISAAFAAAICMGAFSSSAHAFDPAAFGTLIQSENAATSYSPPDNPCG